MNFAIRPNEARTYSRLLSYYFATVCRNVNTPLAVLRGGILPLFNLELSNAVTIHSGLCPDSTFCYSFGTCSFKLTLYFCNVSRGTLFTDVSQRSFRRYLHCISKLLSISHLRCIFAQSKNSVMCYFPTCCIKMQPSGCAFCAWLLWLLLHSHSNCVLSTFLCLVSLSLAYVHSL